MEKIFLNDLHKQLQNTFIFGIIYNRCYIMSKYYYFEGRRTMKIMEEIKEDLLARLQELQKQKEEVTIDIKNIESVLMDYQHKIQDMLKEIKNYEKGSEHYNDLTKGNRSPNINS